MPLTLSTEQRDFARTAVEILGRKWQFDAIGVNSAACRAGHFAMHSASDLAFFAATCCMPSISAITGNIHFCRKPTERSWLNSACATFGMLCSPVYVVEFHDRLINSGLVCRCISSCRKSKSAADALVLQTPSACLKIVLVALFYYLIQGLK